MAAYNTGIVLINYNNNEDTIDCVRSISLLDGPLPFVVVVDNASRKRDVGDLLGFYPHLHVIYSDTNLGFGKANNLGIRWLKENLPCEFVFILNNDTVLQKDTLVKLVKVFEDTPGVTMVTPKILTYEEKPKIWYGGGFFKFSRMTVDVEKFGEEDQQLRSHIVEFASGCAMLFRMQFFDQQEAFDPAIFMYDEDVELCLRMKRADQQILFASDPVVYHKCQGSQKDRNAKSVMNQLNADHPSVRFYLSNTIPNRYYILRRYFKGAERLKIHSTLLIYWLMKSAQYFLKGKISLCFFTIGRAFGL